MRKLLGVVGVDSGQLLVCDPCYIDNQWVKEDFNDIRIIQDPKTKQTFEFRKDFEHYDSILEPYGKKVNDLISEKILIEVKDSDSAKHNFSYNACCKTTLGGEQGGQLNYALGHAGAGVAFRSGLGDGTYEVWAEIGEVEGWGERVKKVEIILIED